MSNPSGDIGEVSTAQQSRGRRWLGMVILGAIMFLAGAVPVWINTTPEIEPASGASAAAAADVAMASLQAQGGPDSVVATFSNGQITNLRADGEKSTAYDEHTPFFVGSLSKTFTALAIARLVDHGSIALDTPVVDYVPEFTAQGPYEEVTVRHLLNQTSGFPSEIDITQLLTTDATFSDRVAALADVELASEPGTEFAYCNLNFTLLALVAEAATGSAYADVVQEQVIEPLGLTDTGVDASHGLSRDVTAGYLPMFGAQLPASTPPYPGAIADGYIVSSAADLAVVGTAIATGKSAEAGYLTPAVLDELQTPPSDVTADPTYDSSYGFGVRVTEIHGQKALFHEGELATMQADLGILPATGEGLIVLSAQHGQLYSGDEPFLAGMQRLAGDSAAAASDGGYRTVALIMTALGAITIAWICVDITRWPQLLRRERRRRLLRNAVPRVLAAAALWCAVFIGVGMMLGQSGAVPLQILWTAAPDLTAIALVAMGFLVLSAIALGGLRQRATPTNLDTDDSTTLKQCRTTSTVPPSPSSGSA